MSDEFEGEELNSYGKPISRNERKARKALSKVGLKQVEGINRVTFKIQNNIFAVAEPEVFKSLTAETYVVYGPAAADDLMQRLQASMGNMNMNMPQGSHAPAVEDDGEDVEAGDLDEDDISSVMEQATCGRNKAISALKEHGTVVDAILALSA